MKNFIEVDRRGTVVIIGQHQIPHMRPPSLADLGLRDLPPQLFRFDLGVREEPAGFTVEKDRIGAHAVLSQNVLQLRPDRVVSAFIFFLMAGFQSHQERFADHFVISISVATVLR